MKWIEYNIRNMRDSEYAQWYALMSEDKKRQVDRLYGQKRKMLSVGGDMLARKMIAQYCRVAPKDIQFFAGEKGKPFVRDINIYFNISHSEDMVICAVSKRPVGVDIEKVKPINLKIAKKVCTPQELCYIFGCIPTEQDFKFTSDIEVLTRFYEIWTLKEAIAKLNGKGLCQLRKNETKKHHINQYHTNGYVVAIVD